MVQSNTRPARAATRDLFMLGASCLGAFVLLFTTNPWAGQFAPERGSLSLDPHEVLSLLLVFAVAGYLFMVRRQRAVPASGPGEIGEIRDRLREAEARYRGLVESIPAVIYIDTPARPWITTYMSPQIEKLLGFTPDDMTGEDSKWLAQVHDDDRERVVAESLHHMRTGDALLGTYRMIARSGEPVWVSRRAAIVRDERGRPMFSQGVIFDVTDFKQMEARLQLLEAAVVNARDAVMISDAEDIDNPQGPRVVYMNQAFTDATGFTPQDLIGKRIGVMRGPRTSMDDLTQLNEILKRGDSGQLEILNYRKDGSEHWIEISVNPITDESGRITHFVSVQRDITQRKVEDERFRALVQNAVDLIWVVGTDGTILWSSPSMETTLGYRPEEVVGYARSDIIHPDDFASAKGAIEAVGEEPGKSTQVEVRVRHKDGTWRQLEVVVTNLINHPSIRGIVINANDVTERQRAESVRREAEERFRRAFDSAPIGMALSGMNGQFLQVNAALAEIMGYSQSDLLSRSFPDIVHPDDVQECVDCMEHLSRDSGQIRQMERRFVHQSGRTVRVHVSLSLVRDAHGEPLHFIAQIEDITERRRLEDELRQGQKMEAVGQLAGGVAHDFNNILSVIQSYARFVIEAVDPAEQVYLDAEEIVKAGDRAVALVRQLLAFSRREIANPVVLDLNGAIEGVEKLLHRTIGEDVQLATRLSEDTPNVTIDNGTFEQLIMNLALNARDAMPGGGLLSIHTDCVTAGGDDSISPALPPGVYAQITVSDSGQGMTPDVLQRIYEPFFTTKSRGRGTGLGLSTVYGIVQQASGDISVRSKVGEGTSFRILLPASDDRLAARTKGIDEPVSPGRNETVLVVEDEDAVRRLVERVLSGSGYRVLVAGSGGEAIDVCRQTENIDLLLSDVIMPQMSGVVVAETVRSMQEGVAVLFMSGYPDETVAHLGVLDRTEMYIQKPFTAGELLRKVRSVLDAAEDPASEDLALPV